MKLCMEVEIDDEKAASIERAWTYLRKKSGFCRYSRNVIEEAYRELADIGLFAVEADMASESEEAAGLE